MQLFTKMILLIFFTLSLFASEATKVLIIHSYTQEYKWTKEQHNSFVSTLQNTDKTFYFNTEYLDTKRLELTSEYQQEFLKYLKFKYKDVNHDMVYVTDDNALKFISENYKKLFQDTKQPPVFFSGINNLEMDKILPKNTFAGVYEVKEIRPNIELIKQFSPQTRNIWFIGDDSNTYNSIKKELQSQHKDFDKMNFNYISSKSITEIQKNLPKSPRSFVILTTIGNIKDEKNKTLMPEESIRRIKENKNIILLSMEDSYMTNGVIGGYVTSANKQGEEAANLVIKYLKNNSLDSISSLTKSPNIYYFNFKELSNSRVILSEYIARNSIIIEKDENFFEKNKSVIFDLLLLSLFMMTLSIITIYALQRKKLNTQSKTIKKLLKTNASLEDKKQFIKNMFTLGGISYWKLDTKNNSLFTSDELVNKLGIDMTIYKNDPNLLTYFTHSSDKELLNENISYVINSKKSVKFSHKMVAENKSVFNVEHIIFSQKNMNNSELTIIGIIKFDK